MCPYSQPRPADVKTFEELPVGAVFFIVGEWKTKYESPEELIKTRTYKAISVGGCKHRFFLVQSRRVERCVMIRICI